MMKFTVGILIGIMFLIWLIAFAIERNRVSIDREPTKEEWKDGVRRK